MIRQPALIKQSGPRFKDPFKLSEHELMNWCISRLSLANFYVWRYNAGKLPIRNSTGKIERMILIGQKGVSDIIGITPDGKFCAFEIKIKPNKPSPAQLDFLATVQSRGGIAKVFYTQEECEKFCKENARFF